MTLRISLWLVALALFASQTLGFLHRVAHAPAQFGAVSQAQIVDPPPQARGWVHELFVGHEGDPSCRLFDQLNASGVLADVPALALPLALAWHFLSWSQGEPRACGATLFDARGPPALR